MMRHNCKYCKQWYNSPIVRKTAKKEGKLVSAKRRCKLIGKKIKPNALSCKWFDPSSVYCEKHNYQIKIINCINRRRNEGGLKAWEYCSKCRQFDREIQPIVNEYWINAKQINIKKNKSEKPEKKIKRRNNKESSEPKKKIKRRKKKRTIKRRKKSPGVVHRKIKRRKQTDVKPKKKIKRRK